MKSKPKGRAPDEPTHYRKTALAHELGISRVTLDAYLNRSDPPPPLPNEAKEWSLEAVANYIASIKTESSAGKGAPHWRAEKLRLECERISHDLMVRRGEFISRLALRTAVAPLMSELGTALEQQFVQILPARCKGKDTVEIADMNRAAVDAIIARFRRGAKELSAA